jgi:TPP-dependent pyruvate/acetoin dehydrogenase alpha subunit
LTSVKYGLVKVNSKIEKGDKRMKITKKSLLEIYEKMCLIRRFEEKAFDMQAQDLIGGSIHLYIGEEAVGATVGHLLNKDDYMCSTHRGHGHILGKGARADKAMAEILGKVDGYCKGRGGSMHIADMENGILGANGIVGGGIPCATGAGLSIKLRKSDQVSVFVRTTFTA